MNPYKYSEADGIPNVMRKEPQNEETKSERSESAQSFVTPKTMRSHTRIFEPTPLIAKHHNFSDLMENSSNTRDNYCNDFYSKLMAEVLYIEQQNSFEVTNDVFRFQAIQVLFLFHFEFFTISFTLKLYKIYTISAKKDDEKRIIFYVIGFDGFDGIWCIFMEYEG